MSPVKAVKWFAIYVLLTLGFLAAAASATFIFVSVQAGDYEFGTLFFFFLFPAGIVSVLIEILTVVQAPKPWVDVDWPAEALRSQSIRSERKDGIVLILSGLTLILVSLTHLLVSG